MIAGADLAYLLTNWGEANPVIGDLDQNGSIGGGDLGVLLVHCGIVPSGVPTLSWATTLEELPDPAVVTDAAFRARMLAVGLPWRVRDTATNIEMLLVPAGTFMMGCSSGDTDSLSDESPVHQVTRTSTFYLGKTEVTQTQWLSEVGSNPSIFSAVPHSPSCPVEYVSWIDVQLFCMQSSARLPTEAEWEYACRGGDLTSHSGMLDDLAWYSSNSGSQTHAVAGRFANALGFYDMIGNVWEWNQDWYGAYSAPSVTNPTGSAAGYSRFKRGAGWNIPDTYCRASVRSSIYPSDRSSGVGFRMARTP